MEALRPEKTVNELAGAYDVHPNQVSNWKREAQAGLVEIFSTKRGRQAAHELAERDRLYSQLGRLQVEVDGLKKSLGCAASAAPGLARAGGRGAVGESPV